MIDPGRRPQASTRSLRGVVTSGAPSAHAGLALQLDRGVEEVVHEPPLVAVPVIDGAECFGRFVSIPAQHLAHLRPVLLLDVGIVVLLIGPAPGECDIAGDAVLPNPVGNKFRAVVRVEAAQDQGQSRVALVEGEGDAALALASTARVSPQPVWRSVKLSE